MEKVLPCQLLHDDLAKMGKDGLSEVPDDIVLYEFQLSYGQLIRGKAIPRNEFLETIQALGGLDSLRADIDLQRRIGEKFQDFNQKVAVASRKRLNNLESGDRSGVQDALKLPTQSLEDIEQRSRKELLDEFDERERNNIERLILRDAMFKSYPLSVLFSAEGLEKLRVKTLPSEVRVKLKSVCQEAAEEMRKRLLNLQYMMLVDTLLDGDVELLKEETFHFIQSESLPVPPLDLLLQN